MKNNKKIVILDIIALIISVLTISIAYAAISRNSVMVREYCEGIDVKFENVSNPIISGEATALGTPKIKDNGVLLTNISAKLKKPKDEVRYKADIVNKKDFDVRISYIINPNLTEQQKKTFDFSVIYTNDKKKVKVGDKLKKNERKNITIILSYKDIEDENLLPNNGYNMNLSYSIVYVRKDNRKPCKK